MAHITVNPEPMELNTSVLRISNVKKDLLAILRDCERVSFSDIVVRIEIFVPHSKSSRRSQKTGSQMVVMEVTVLMKTYAACRNNSQIISLLMVKRVNKI